MVVALAVSARQVRASGPRATPRGGWPLKTSPNLVRQRQCPSTAVMPQRLRSLCPAPSGQHGLVPWGLCCGFFLEILKQTQVCIHQGHRIIDPRRTPNPRLKPVAEKKSEEKGMNKFTVL